MFFTTFYFFPVTNPFIGYLLILTFIINNSCFGQKKYQFDHLIEYQFESYEDSSSNKTLYYITNSKDNSYYAKIESLDSLNFEIEFIVQDLIWAKISLKKEDFSNLESLTLECESDFLYKNDFKFRVEEYEFNMLADTLMDNKYFKHYKLQYIGKRKRKKSFPVGTNHYIIRDSTQFHLPILTHSTAFEEWKKERNIPNGIFEEIIFYNYKNEISYKYIIKEYHSINKTIFVPDKCLERNKMRLNSWDLQIRSNKKRS
ncbi:hypothetical protein GIHI108528_04995 [Gillisia hiemivivida]